MSLSRVTVEFKRILLIMNQAEDVEIIIGHKHRYKFHSGTLARNSTFFADMLTEHKAAKLSNRARSAGIKIRWMIELKALPSEQHPAGRLALVELNPNGERADGGNGLVVNENGRIPQARKVFSHYESIFYAFYNKDLSIDDTDMSAALSDCYQLLLIADHLGCPGLIRKPIEVALLKHGQDLFRAIQDAPHAWVEMGYRIRSELVFRECMIHLVGKWKTYKDDRNMHIYIADIPGLRALIKKYHHLLLKKCRALELALMSHYPGHIRLPVEDLPIKREAYAKDILVWMALTFFRHWVGQRLNMEKGYHGDDCGYELYKQIGTAGEAYMDKSIINQFHTRFPMTKKAMNVLENHLLEIKECMKSIVEEHKILKSNCQLDTYRFPVGYLTCTDFQKSDCPWENTTEGLMAQSTKRKYKPGGNDIARSNLNTARVGQKKKFGVGLEYESEFDSAGDDIADGGA
ncbi:Aldo keto reductase [Pyrenophora seminiperda CCB06]|uniref:Aldo keto reductase n=1 Tax=Pyrenophora seminiperda CCB06 TaxID=1302712 RepID=A0A3M7M511_9PLEO|nr:Aldo keto reductase [Pyrenophora seminiperda CCB06]